MKTIFVNENDAVRNWYVIDATDKPVGRVAAKAAAVLRGKHKATYTPNQEMGDSVIIINATKAAMTGNKKEGKIYRKHTGFVGGLKSNSYRITLERHPEEPMMRAIKGMLPSGPLGRRLLTNVKVYGGAEHSHAAQNPQPLEV
jgi:large subunit ribosomal protein L13